MTLTYRSLHTIEELEHAVDIEIAVWGMSPRDAAPSYLMHAAVHNGSVAFGAFDGDRMVGMNFAMPARRGGDGFLWSHITGVLPGYQGRGVGLELKRAQREWALAQGYTTIRWTFDPLQRGNAHFNFGVLGALAPVTSNVYLVNHYGDMDDAINAGMPSDRIEASWHIREAARAQDALLLATTRPLLTTRDDQRPHLHAADWDAPAYRAELPRDLAPLRAQDAGLPLAWRLALREALQAAFAHGYHLAGFTHGGYTLRREEA